MGPHWVSDLSPFSALLVWASAELETARGKAGKDSRDAKTKVVSPQRQLACSSWWTMFIDTWNLGRAAVDLWASVTLGTGQSRWSPRGPHCRGTLIGRKCIKRLKGKVCSLLSPTTCYSRRWRIGLIKAAVAGGGVIPHPQISGWEERTTGGCLMDAWIPYCLRAQHTSQLSSVGDSSDCCEKHYFAYL